MLDHLQIKVAYKSMRGLKWDYVQDLRLSEFNEKPIVLRLQQTINVNDANFLGVFPSTGKKDINDRPIYYDSEIVKFRYCENRKGSSELGQNIWLTGVFRWHDDELRAEVEVYGAVYYTVLSYTSERMTEIEVIGTVQENPKLIGLEE